MLNNKGFAITSVLYTLLIAFLLFLGACLTQFSSSTKIFSKANTDLSNQYLLPDTVSEWPYGVRVYYIIDENNYKYPGRSGSAVFNGLPSNYYFNVKNKDGKYVNTFIMQNGSNESYSVFGIFNSDSIGYKISLSDLPSKNIMDSVKTNGYVLNGWDVEAQYLYKDDCLGDKKNKTINAEINRFNLSKYIKNNAPDSKCEVNYIQVFYRAKWEPNVNIYYNIKSVPSIDNSNFEDDGKIKIKEEYNDYFEKQKGSDGLFLKNKAYSTVALFSSLTGNTLESPEYPIKSTNKINVNGKSISVNDIIEYEGYTLKGWKATIHSSCDTSNIASRPVLIENTASEDEITVSTINKAIDMNKLNMQCNPNATAKIIYNAIWEQK